MAIPVFPFLRCGLGVALTAGLMLGAGCTPCEPIAPLRSDSTPGATAGKAPAATASTASADEARAFMDATEAQLRLLWSHRERLGFVQSTYITHDTEQLAAQSEEQVMEFVAKKVKEASRFEGATLPAELRRKLDLLKLAQTLAAPPEPAERSELARIAASMEGHYGKAKYCPPKLGGKCLTLDDLERTLKSSRSYDELLDIWVGWHEQAKPLAGPYARYVALANKGAKAQGHGDLGVLWRSKYDMPPAAFGQEVERLWQQVEPFYKAIHCYTRMKLRGVYGQRVPESGPIPAHLLGNMWAQEWANIYPLVAPAGKGRGLDLSAVLKAKKVTPQGLVKYGENFFTSLGLESLPDSFWQRSMFVRPRDRDVVCHASAWDLSFRGDLRLKMCIELDDDNFRTVHHELGHIYYYWYYRDLPTLFQWDPLESTCRHASLSIL